MLYWILKKYISDNSWTYDAANRHTTALVAALDLLFSQLPTHFLYNSWTYDAANRHTTASVAALDLLFSQLPTHFLYNSWTYDAANRHTTAPVAALDLLFSQLPTHFLYRWGLEAELACPQSLKLATCLRSLAVDWPESWTFLLRVQYSHQ